MCSTAEALGLAFGGPFGFQVGSALTKPEKPPGIPALPPVPQEDKAAKKNIAGEIKRQKARSRSTKPKDTLLSGGTVTDGTLNLSAPTLLVSR